MNANFVLVSSEQRVSPTNLLYVPKVHRFSTEHKAITVYNAKWSSETISFFC